MHEMKRLFDTPKGEHVSIHHGISEMSHDGKYIELRKGNIIFVIIDYCENTLAEPTIQHLEKLARELWWK